MMDANIIGKTFNYLTVIKRTENKNRHIRLDCKCKCGNIKNVRASDLKSGAVKSCGCHPVGRAAIEEGVHYRTPEYNIWAAMIQRCTNPNNKKYPIYGGAGVCVCERWRKFEFFLEDMGYRPSPELSLDRFPNKKGNYELSNCRWATIEQQNRNLTSNVWIKHNGQEMILKDWAVELNVDASSLRKKLKNGRSFNEIYNRYKKTA
jgi:hypothetical protein